MKTKILAVSILLVLPILISGCGNTDKNKVGLGDVADNYGAARDLSDDMNDPSKISSQDNIDNLYALMNYQGNESESAIKSAISQGIDDGKDQDDLNKEIVLKQDLGGAYMIGYVFGCQSVTGDEDMCNDDMGEMYQAIMIEELQGQFPEMDMMTE